MTTSVSLGRRAVLQVPVVAAVASVPTLAVAGSTPAKDAYAYFIWPTDGERIRGPFWCRFGLRNMGVAPAGVDVANTGHHHLFIDVDESLSAGLPIPADKKHIHFGSGQTETRLELPPGKYSMQLVLGDANHVPFDPPVVSRKIHIVVV